MLLVLKVSSFAGFDVRERFFHGRDLLTYDSMLVIIGEYDTRVRFLRLCRWTEREHESVVLRLARNTLKVAEIEARKAQQITLNDG